MYTGLSEIVFTLDFNLILWIVALYFGFALYARGCYIILWILTCTLYSRFLLYTLGCNFILWIFLLYTLGCYFILLFITLYSGL